MGRIRLGRYTTQNIDQHVALIKQMVDRSVRDPEVRQLAVKIVSGRTFVRNDPRTGQPREYIRAWNDWFLAPPQEVCPPREDECEVIRVWDFVVQNFRYVYDPAEVDTFATVYHSLEAGGGDCDDATILFCSLLNSIGFHTRARVIATGDAPQEWVHIYPLVGLPKDNPTKWVPLDMTVTGFEPGDEYHDIAKSRDFEM